jgi:hypothetical protein
MSWERCPKTRRKALNSPKFLEDMLLIKARRRFKWQQMIHSTGGDTLPQITKTEISGDLLLDPDRGYKDPNHKR